MRVFVTGATGELGRPTIALLLEQGHDVRCSVRDARGTSIVRQLGAEPVPVDLFAAEAVRTAVAGADVVAHLATAIPPSAEMGDLSTWVTNDRLRRETTAHLVAAVRATSSRLLLQSYFAVAEPRGDDWIEEPADREPRWSDIDVMGSMRAAEESAREVDAVILRFGSLYSETSEQLQAQVGFLEAGGASIPGDGNNYWPYVATSDAAAAVVGALSLPGGVYDIADDAPMTLEMFWTMAANAVGTAKPPHGSVDGHPMAPILLGSWRTSNRHFCAASGWSPRIPSVLEGWPEAVARFRAERPGLRPA